MKLKLILCLALVLNGGWFGSLIIANGQTNTSSPSSKPDIGLIKAKAEIGNARAQAVLGLDYLGGDGVPKDSAQAFYWFKKAAEQGDACGEGGVGTAYINGEGVAKDGKEAFKWFKKAADQGFFPAQDQLGVLYANGMGCDKDLAEAYKWFSLSARQGYSLANEHQSALAQIMTPDQIYEGYQRANTFIPIVEDQTNLVVAGRMNSNPANGAAKPKTMAEVQTELKTGYANFIPAVTNRLGTNFGPVAAKVLASFETNILSALTNSAMAELDAGAKFLTELKKQGRVPGVSKDSHAEVTGGLHTDNLKMSELKEAKYPFSLTFNVVLTGDSLTNHYTIMRASPDADWQLQRAWRTDTEGHTIKEWPVK
jgi:hypothetical protein